MRNLIRTIFVFLILSGFKATTRKNVRPRKLSFSHYKLSKNYFNYDVDTMFFFKVTWSLKQNNYLLTFTKPHVLRLKDAVDKMVVMTRIGIITILILIIIL